MDFIGLDNLFHLTFYLSPTKAPLKLPKISPLKLCFFRPYSLYKFCYGHRLLNYEGKCRHLHGHNGRAIITLEAADLDAKGMLVDFTEIKRHVQAWIDENLDHNMLLHRDDPLLPTLRERGERVFVMDQNPTAESIARLIFDQAARCGLPVVEVILWETDNCHAAYRGR